MKNLYYKGTPEKLQQLLEEYRDAGHNAEIIDGELVVYAGKPPTKPKKGKQNKQQKAEKWSKRERNFGYTRG